jgi:hypothetical protein
MRALPLGGTAGFVTPISFLGGTYAITGTSQS